MAFNVKSWVLLVLACPLFGQMGSGEAFGVSLDVSGNVISGVVVAGLEVGPVPLVQLVDQTTTDSQSSLLVDIDMMGHEAMASDNIASVSTAYDATIGAQEHLSGATIDNVDVLVDTTVALNLLTLTATSLAAQAMVTGPCGSGGTGDLVESGTVSIVDLSVSILGVAVESNLSGSAFTTIDLSTVAGLGVLGVTGSLTLNRVTVSDGGATGSGSVEAVVLELSLQAGATALGLGNAAGVDLTIAFADAGRDCNSLPVGLVSFSVE